MRYEQIGGGGGEGGEGGPREVALAAVEGKKEKEGGGPTDRTGRKVFIFVY